MKTEELLKYCRSDRQREVVRAVHEHGSQSKAARALDVDKRTVERALARIRKNAAQVGFSPEHGLTHPAAPGFKLAGYSDMRTNEEGKPIWYKFSKERAELQTALQSFAQSLTDDIKQAAPSPAPRIEHHTPDLMTGIFIGDAHIGMRAFGKETKHHDFDTDIATRQLREAADYLIDRAEPTETGLLVNVGDFMHANGGSNTTYAGTQVDVDTRQHRTMREAGMVMRYMIDRMLSKFKNVVVVVARGNHDTDPAPAVQLMLEFYYDRDPRVKILNTEGFYHYIEYGRWLFGVHHGDKQKPEALAASMARDMPKAWGRTTHRMWCCGHFHKEQVKSLPGVKYKVFGALPPPDSWHAAHGFKGDGEMEMITFRKSGGIHSSHVYNVPQPEMEPDATI